MSLAISGATEMGEESQAPDARAALMDALLMAGLLESPGGEDVLEAIRESYRRRIEIENQALADDLAALSAEAARAEKQRLVWEEELQKLKDMADVQDNALLELEAKRDSFQRLSRARQADLVSRRGTYPLRALERRVSDTLRAREGIGSQLLEAEKNKLQIEKSLFELERERRELNRPEYERRVSTLREQQSHAEERYARVDAQLAELRGLGITRTTAGFLSWSGYVSFAGIGWMVGEYLRELVGHKAGMVSGLFALLVGGFRVLTDSLGIAAALGIVIALPFFVGLVGMGVLIASDRLLRRFDSRWQNRPSAKGAATKAQKGPWSLVSSGAKEVRREDYGQWIARIPLYCLVLFLISVAAVLFSLGGRELSATEFARLAEEPFEAVLFAFVGVVLCVLATGLVILYVTRVVEHRSVVGAAGQRPVGSLAREFKLIAIVAVALAVGALALAAIPGLRERFGTAVEGAFLVLAILAGGLTTAYGLVYKGLFRDLAALRREAEQFADEIERFAAWPVLAVVTDEIDAYREDLWRLHEEVARLWSEADYWEIPAERWLIRTGLWDSPQELQQIAERRSRLSVDELLEPALVGEIVAAVSEVGSLTVEIERVKGRIAEAKARIAGLETMVRGVDEGRFEGQRAERTRRCLEQLAVVQLEQAEAMGRYEAAYHAGGVLRGGVREPSPVAA